MKFKNLFLFTLATTLWGFPLITYAQFSLEGTVFLESGEKGKYANIILYQLSDSSFAQGTLSDEKGSYQLKDISVGIYELRVNLSGYQSYRLSPISLQESPFQRQLEDITLQEKQFSLEEVEINATQPLYVQQEDKLIINVEKSILTVGGDALHILSRSPGVNINSQLGFIAINGKEGVLIAINGKTSRMPVDAAIQMLQSMPASSIAKIELINNPPAQYDAEGNAGVINIILKDHQTHGASANISLNAGYYIGNDERIGTIQGYAGGFSTSFQYRNDKLNLLGHYSFQRKDPRHIWDNDREIISQAHRVRTISDRDPLIDIHNARLSLDYSINEKTIIGGILGGYINFWDLEATNTTERSSPDLERSASLMETIESSHWNHFMGNFFFTHQFSTSSQLQIDWDYLYYHHRNPSDYQLISESLATNPSPFPQWSVSKETPINIMVGKVDYQTTLKEHWNIDLGIKSSISEFTNDVSFTADTTAEIFIVGLESTHLSEDVWAGYANVQTQLDSLTKLSLGIRYEHTESLLQNSQGEAMVRRSYGNLLPNFQISHEFRPELRLSFAYNRRITRPTFNNLAPFVLFMDANLLSTGNTALLPSFGDVLKLQLNLHHHNFSFEYSRQKDAIVGFQPIKIEGTQQFLYRPENLDLFTLYTLTWNAPLDITSNWSSQNSLSLMYQTLASDHLGFPLEDQLWTFQLSSQHRIQLAEDMALEVSGNFYAKRFFRAYVIEPYGTFNLGIQKTWNKGMESLTLGVEDAFWTNRWEVKRNIPENDIFASWDYVWDPTLIRLTYTKKLGKPSMEKATRRLGGSAEEQKRVR